MNYVLIFFWSFHNTPLAMHSSPDVITYTLSGCHEAGLKWLKARRVDDVQTRHAYTCEVGQTSYMLAGKAR